MRIGKSRDDSRRPACGRSLPSDWLRKAWLFRPICSIHKRCTNADRSDRTRDFRYDSVVFTRVCLVAPNDGSPWDGPRDRTDPKVVGSRGGSTIGDRSEGVAQRHSLAARSLDQDASISAPPRAPPAGRLSCALGHLCAGYAALGAGRRCCSPFRCISRCCLPFSLPSYSAPFPPGISIGSRASGWQSLSVSCRRRSSWCRVLSGPAMPSRLD